jgi:hypothetical protein
LTFCGSAQIGTILSVSNVSGRTYQWYQNGAPILNQTSNQLTVTGIGNYSCLITAPNGCAIQPNVIVQSNPIPATPIISYSGSTTFCSGESLLLTAPVGYTYQWKKNNINISGATNLTYLATNTGSYVVTITNAGCSSTSSSLNINVNPSPTIPTINSGPTTFCLGGSVTLTSSSATGNTWSNGSTSQSITVNQSGSYSVTVSNGNCSSTSSPTIVTVNPLPTTPLINSSGQTTFCLGGSVILTSSSLTNNTWSNGSTSQSITVNQSGSYSVTVSNGNCSSTSNPIQITVNPLPSTPLINNNGPTTFCLGGSVTLTSSSVTGNTWSNGATSQSITVTTSGNYSVTVSNGTCSSTSTPTIVTVSPLPTSPVITAIGNSTFCQGDSVLLVSSYNSGNIWSNGSTNASIYVLQSGAYNVQFMNVNGCISSSSSSIVTVLPLPQVTIATSGSTTICEGENVVLTSSPSSSYFWSNGSISQSITVDQSGVYTVQCTSTNGCSNISAPKTVNVNLNTSSIINTIGLDSYTLNNQTYTQSGTYTQIIPNAAGCDSTITLNLTLSFSGIDELFSSIKIYPNPTTGKITLEGNFIEQTKFSIRDAIGKEVLNGVLINSDINTIDLENIARGSYNLLIDEFEIPFRIIKN